MLLVSDNMTDLNEIELPTNKKFGWFFCGVFMCVSLFCLYKTSLYGAYIFGFISATFGLLALLLPDLLLPLNKLWIRLGLTLGKIINPVVMGVMFFLLITPTALILRVCGRDELNLKTGSEETYWKTHHKKEHSAENFLNQY